MINCDKCNLSLDSKVGYIIDDELMCKKCYDNNFKIIHGISKYTYGFFHNMFTIKSRKYKKDIYSIIPPKFKGMLADRHQKWNNPKIEFTYAERDGICAIAIVHPLDHFNRKIGVKICKGRIRRAVGEILDSSGNPKPYKRLPNSVYINSDGNKRR